MNRITQKDLESVFSYYPIKVETRNRLQLCNNCALYLYAQNQKNEELLGLKSAMCYTAAVNGNIKVCHKAFIIKEMYPIYSDRCNHDLS
jgi:hypothetical protein